MTRAAITIALDAQSTLGIRSGVGWYATNLVQALLARAGPERYRLVVSSFGEQPRIPFAHPGADLIRLRVPTLSRRWPIFLQRAAFARKYHRLLPAALRAAGVRIYHGLNFFAPPAGPWRRVVTVHDVDFLRHPARQTASNRALFRSLVVPELRGMDAVIVPSKAVRHALVSALPVPAARVHVVPEAAAPGFFEPVPAWRIESLRSAYRLPRRFALCVGAAEPRKNFETAVRAVASLRRDQHLALVLAGPPGWGGVDLDAVARGAGLDADRFRQLGYVDSENLPALYRAATMLLVPSLDEGFGLPVVEAFAAGTPVLCSDRGSLPEVSGGAAIVLPAEPVSAWAAAIERVASSSRVRARLNALGRRRAKAWTWDDAAARTLEIYRRCR